MKPEYGYAERDEDDEFDEDEEEAEEEDDGMIDRQKGRRLIKGFSTVSARLSAPFSSHCPFCLRGCCGTLTLCTARWIAHI